MTASTNPITFDRYPQNGERVTVLKRWRCGTGNDRTVDFVSDDEPIHGILHMPGDGRRELLNDKGHVIAEITSIPHTVYTAAEPPQIEIVGLLDCIEGLWLVTSAKPR